MSNHIALLCVISVVITTWTNGADAQPTPVTVQAAFNDGEHIVLIANDKALYINSESLQEEKLENVTTIKLRRKDEVQAAIRVPGPEEPIVLYFYEKKAFLEDVSSNMRVSRLTYNRKRRFLRGGGPDAAATIGDTLYVFKGCKMVEAENWKQFVRPVDIRDQNLPCSPDAAWTHQDGITILKGDRIWTWTGEGKAEGPCPFSDTYSISSWSLAASSESPVCPEGYVFNCLKNRCYRMFTESKNYDSATAYCRDEGEDGMLARVDSTRMVDFIWQLTGSSFPNLWIGLDDRQEEMTFRWQDDNSTNTFDGWFNGEPNESTSEDCTHIVGQIKQWNDANCDLEMGFICQVKPSYSMD